MPLPTTPQIGGFGVIAHGRHKYGAQDSLDFQSPPEPLGPRFNLSYPMDGARNVALEQWITFELYCYSSSFNYDDPSGDGVFPFEISEDGGVTWEYANIAPYTCKVRPKDAQIAWILIAKSTPWANHTEIVIRTTVQDEFGQDATSEIPVRWE